MHSGFSNLRSALPMNLKAHYPGFKVWPARRPISTASRRSGANASRSPAARSCSAKSPAWPTPCSRRCARALSTYDVKLDAVCAAYCKAIMALPHMQEWIEAAKTEPEELEELDVEF